MQNVSSKRFNYFRLSFRTLLQFSKALTEVKIEGTRREERRREQLHGDLKEKRIYWNLKEEALDRTVWRKRFGRGCPVARQITHYSANEVKK
jgi:hypothetical protein